MKNSELKIENLQPKRSFKKILNSPLSIIHSSKGFTLIELMVAIAIVAIIATIGITLFNRTQATARDGRRKQDIDAIASSMESHFNTNAGQFCQNGTLDSYCQPQASWFAGNAVPLDPLNVVVNGDDTKTYVYYNNGNVGTDNNHTVPIADNDPNYLICAHLENGGGNASDVQGTSAAGSSASYYCRHNQQQ